MTKPQTDQLMLDVCAYAQREAARMHRMAVEQQRINEDLGMATAAARAVAEYYWGRAAGESKRARAYLFYIIGAEPEENTQILADFIKFVASE